MHYYKYLYVYCISIQYLVNYIIMRVLVYSEFKSYSVIIQNVLFYYINDTSTESSLKYFKG